MHQRFFLFLAACLAICSASLAENFQAEETKEVSANCIVLGLRGDDVTRILGDPTKRFAEKLHQGESIARYAYSSFEVLMKNDRVVGVSGEELEFSLGKTTIACGPELESAKLCLDEFALVTRVILGQNSYLLEWNVGEASVSCVVTEGEVELWMLTAKGW